MINLHSFSQFIGESQHFDTRAVANISDLKVGEEIFQLGTWYLIDRVEGDKAILRNPETRTFSVITQKDLDRVEALVKVPLSYEAEQAEEGQPDIPDYTHIDLPDTQQRIEGPKETEAAVRSLLRKVISEQRKVQMEYRDSQEDARNEAANVLFNYSDELSGLGWMII